MKKLLTLAAVTLLTASLSFAQTSPGDAKQSSTKTTNKATEVKTGAKKTKPGDTISLNPQPLPPKQAGGQKSSAASQVSLNPQPLPPRTSDPSKKSSQAKKLELNPQPEPPGVARSDSKAKGKKAKGGAAESGKNSAPKK